jgi:hypothetical protein
VLSTDQRSVNEGNSGLYEEGSTCIAWTVIDFLYRFVVKLSDADRTTVVLSDTHIVNPIVFNADVTSCVCESHGVEIENPALLQQWCL